MFFGATVMGFLMARKSYICWFEVNFVINSIWDLPWHFLLCCRGVPGDTAPCDWYLLAWHGSPFSTQPFVAPVGGGFLNLNLNLNLKIVYSTRKKYKHDPISHRVHDSMFFVVGRPLQRSWAHRLRKGHPQVLQCINRHCTMKGQTFGSIGKLKHTHFMGQSAI